MFFKVLISLCGDSKRTIVESLFFNLTSLALIFASDFGKNPLKVTLFIGRPETDNAAMNADAPGIGIIRTPLLIHSRTNLNPGSDINGVPASEISATSFVW